MRPALLALATGILATGTLATPAAHADPTQWSVNGHYYEFFNADVTWAEAAALAASKTFNGLQAYLATVTDAAENDFVSREIGLYQLGWLGASDNGVEGRWAWQAGPEKGQALTWFNWTANEPNNAIGGENYLQTNWQWAGEWNDHGGPGATGQTNGYFVEYSVAAAVPEPASFGMLLLGLAGIAAVLSRRRG